LLPQEGRPCGRCGGSRLRIGSDFSLDGVDADPGDIGKTPAHPTALKIGVSVSTGRNQEIRRPQSFRNVASVSPPSVDDWPEVCRYVDHRDRPRNRGCQRLGGPNPEPGGGDANVWLIEPGTDGLCALFKPVVAKAGRRQGEDWAEKAVEQIAHLLNIPSARILMATRRGQAGLLSYDLAPGGSELQTGAVMIGEIDDRLIPRAKERFGHNLDNIYVVLSRLAAVAMPDKFTAYDQFCGYLILDALVANRDRHEENWGVLRDPEGRVTLAPSYDHGNSLGFNLADALGSASWKGIPTWPIGRVAASRIVSRDAAG
jgi:hypothetical protein